MLQSHENGVDNNQQDNCDVEAFRLNELVDLVLELLPPSHYLQLPLHTVFLGTIYRELWDVVN
jgi:hypothetical protein